MTGVFLLSRLCLVCPVSPDMHSCSFCQQFEDEVLGTTEQPLFPAVPGEEVRGFGPQVMHHLVVNGTGRGNGGAGSLLAHWGSLDVEEQRELAQEVASCEELSAGVLEEAVEVCLFCWLLRFVRVFYFTPVPSLRAC